MPGTQMTLFLKGPKTPKQGRNSNQNDGHLASRCILTWLNWCWHKMPNAFFRKVTEAGLKPGALGGNGWKWRLNVRLKKKTSLKLRVCTWKQMVGVCCTTSFLLRRPIFSGYVSFREGIFGQIIATFSRRHPKWWVNRGIPPKIPEQFRFRNYIHFAQIC